MKDYYIKNKRKYIVYISLFFLFIILLSLFTYDFQTMRTGQEILFAGTCLIAWIGICYGILASLGTSLIEIMIFGTFLLWKSVSPTSFIDVKNSILWMILFVVAAVVSGVLHQLILNILLENDEMKRKFDDLVSIDEYTGFDNKKRFFFELEEEYKRAERVQSRFSLILIQVEYFDEFQSLYGLKETIHFLKEISSKIESSTRISDKRFRIEEDLFALILPHTVGENNLTIVMNKIEEKVKTHVLLKDKKQITVTLSFGHSSYTQALGHYREMYEHAMDEVQRYIR